MSGSGWPYLLVPFIPVAIALELVHASATTIFVTSAAGVIPTAALKGRATEELAARSGSGIGGFLNVTFGNAPELIIAFFALNEWLQEVVKASLVGSILGNVLLVMGAAMLVGGIGRDRQFFDRTAANVTSLMLLLAVRRADRAGDLRARAGHGPAASGRRGGQLRLRRREAVSGGRDRPAPHVRRRPVLLAADAQGSVQPRARRGGPRRRAVALRSV